MDGESRSHQVCVVQMDKNRYTNEGVVSDGILLPASFMRIGTFQASYLEHGVLYGGEGARAWADSLGLGRASVALAEDGAGGDDHHVAAAEKKNRDTPGRVGVTGGSQ